MPIYQVDIDALSQELGAYKTRVQTELNSLEKQIIDLHNANQPAGEVDITALKELVDSLPLNPTDLATPITEMPPVPESNPANADLPVPTTDPTTEPTPEPTPAPTPEPTPFSGDPTIDAPTS